jgi:hypothetical protein
MEKYEDTLGRHCVEARRSLMIWKFLRDTRSTISAIAGNTKDQMQEHGYRTQPQAALEKDKGVVAQAIDYVADKIIPKEKPNVSIGRAFVPGQSLDEEQRDWLRAWHENERAMRAPGHDLRATIGGLPEHPDLLYLKRYDPSIAAYTQTMVAQGADPVKIKSLMDERISRLRRQHGVLSDINE